jgi:hypothetical protein
LNQRDARHVDGQVQEEVAGIQEGCENLPVIVPRQRGLDEFDPELFSFAPPAVFRGDDGDAIGRSANVTQDQWQDTLSDAAETHEYDLARKFHMHFVCAHNSVLILVCPLIWFSTSAGRTSPAYLAVHEMLKFL